MSSSRPSPSSRDDNSFSSRDGSAPNGSASGGSSRPDSSQSTSGSRSDAGASREAQAPPPAPRMTTPRAATGAGAGSATERAGTSGSGVQKGVAPGAAGAAMKWAAMGGIGVLALAGFFVMNSRAHSSATPVSVNANGQTSGGGAAAEPDRLTIFVGADVSKSVTPSIRETSMDGLKFALRQAVPGGTKLHFVFYDTNARTLPNSVEFYEPRDLDEVAVEFKKYDPRPEKGTTQAFAIQRLRKEAAELPAGTPYAFVLITDGEDYDKPATREQAQQLAQQSDFRGLLVIGAQMETKDRIYLRDQIQDSLAPLGRKRLVCGAEVSESDADTFQALMSK